MHGAAGAIAGGLATVLAALIVFVQPVRGKRRYEQLRLDVEVDPTARTRFFRRSIVAQWIVVAVVAVIAALAAVDHFSFSLGPGDNPTMAWAATIELAVLLPVSILFIRSRRRKVAAFVARQAANVRVLLPVTRDEQRTFVGVALTAGICEEIVFRGFGILYLRWLWPAIPDAALVAIIAVVFGLGHYYQGVRGVLLIAIVGALFTGLTLQAGTLVPAMIVHTLIDLRVIAIPPLADQDDGGSDSSTARISSP